MDDYPDSQLFFKVVWDRLYRQLPMQCHLSQCFKDLSAMQQVDQLCDTVVKTGNISFRAHRIVLAGWSPYFRALFLFPSVACNGNGDHVADLGNFSSSSVQLMLDMMYCKTELLGYDVDFAEMMRLADFIQCQMITDRLLQVVGCAFSTRNCFQWLKLAQLQGLSKLRDLVLQYIASSLPAISGDDAFKLVALSSVRDVFQQPQLLALPIPILFEAVLAWCSSEHNKHSLPAACELARDLLQYCQNSCEDNKKVLSLFEDPRFRSLKGLQDTIFNSPNLRDVILFSPNLHEGIAVFDSKHELVKSLESDACHMSRLIPSNSQNSRNFFFVYRQQLYVIGQSASGILSIQRYDPVLQVFADAQRFQAFSFASLPNESLRLSAAVCRERTLYLFFHPNRVDARSTVLRKFNMDDCQMYGEQICFDADTCFFNVAFSHDGTLAVFNGLQNFYLIDQSNLRVIKCAADCGLSNRTVKLESCDIANINEIYNAFVTCKDRRSLLLVYTLDMDKKCWNSMCSVDVIGCVYKVFVLTGQLYIIHSFLNYERCCNCSKASCCGIHLEERYFYRCVSKFSLLTQTLEKLHVKLPERNFQIYALAVPGNLI